MKKQRRVFYFKDEEFLQECKKEIKKWMKEGYGRKKCCEMIIEKYKLDCIWQVVYRHCFIGEVYKKKNANHIEDKTRKPATGFSKLKDRVYREKLLEEFVYLYEKCGKTAQSLNSYFKKKYDVNGYSLYHIYKGKTYQKPSCSMSDKQFYLREKYGELIKELRERESMSWPEILKFIKSKYNEKLLYDAKQLSDIYNKVPVGIKVEEE